jgi:thiol:disulfide interchange protein
MNRGFAGWAARLAIVGMGLTVGVAAAGAQMTSPAARAHIYPGVETAQADIKAALAEARREHKRVIVDFGGDWCGDCQVLNIYFHQSPNAELLKKYYVLVDVNVGQIDTNLNLGDKYGVVLKKGVPALAVLRPDGTVVYGQKSGEFENMRNMNSQSVTDFLNKWKP